ncbi:hypothetical protein FACS1894145_2180 [Bacteroidia bacterium]|nr:hypothetical protein FACS1894145_2180 [Bacteroidia bacterium]
MIQSNGEKTTKLHSYDEILDKKYGKRGTTTRTTFEEKAIARYYADILKERRKELHITQHELAKKTGKERSYIARIEKGETDMQLSSFLGISNALGLQVQLGTY